MSGFFKIGKEDLLSRAIPSSAGLVVCGVNDAYVFDTTHQDPAVFAARIILPEVPLLNPTYVDGILRASNTEWVAAGAGVVDRSLNLLGVIISFKQDANVTLFAFLDSATVGLPQTLTGINITANWNAAGILKL